MLQILSLAFILAGAPQPAPSGLHIVVVEGEAGVNIIQQKTAVKPLIEVRDRNNLPVPGAMVTFSVGGQAASFGGASTLTVATNAAGQAAVSGLTPNIAGAFQIQVSAAFQGQVATAAIAQTNVLTAAEAAAATGAGGAGGASGAGGGAGGGASGAAGGAAGGGLSTTTLVVAGAAVAGGAVAAKEVVSKAEEAGDLKFTGSFSGTINTVVTSRIAGTCTIRRSVTATARLLFKQHSDSAVTGQFDYTGTDTVVATTCPAATTADPNFLGQVDLTGSPSRFSGRNVFSAPAGSPVNGTNTYSFEGSISGDSASGTFNYEQKTSSTGTNGQDLIESIGTGTFPITFQKAQ